MKERYHNPFVNADLVAPVPHRQHYEQFCRTADRRANIDRSPFPRMIDFWFAGLTLAARAKKTMTDLAGVKTFKFHDGSILDSDSWRVQAVMLIAIAYEESVDIVGEPRKVIQIANGLAATGVPLLVEMLEDGDQMAIWNMSESIEQHLKVGP